MWFWVEVWECGIYLRPCGEGWACYRPPCLKASNRRVDKVESFLFEVTQYGKDVGEIDVAVLFRVTESNTVSKCVSSAPFNVHPSWNFGGISGLNVVLISKRSTSKVLPVEKARLAGGKKGLRCPKKSNVVWLNLVAGLSAG